MNFISINGVTRLDRNEVIDRAKRAIGESGGWIVDFKMFSNVSICINFEIPAADLARLKELLSRTGLELDEKSLEKMSAIPASAGKPGEPDVIATLQITFVHNEPDLRIEVPAVPG